MVVASDELLLNQILTGIGQPFYVLDSDWRFSHYNDEAARYFGRPAAEMLGRRVWDVFPGEVEHERGRILREAMAARRPVHGEAQSMISERLVSYSMFPLGEGMGVLFHDVSARRDAEEAVHERTATLEAVLETIPTAVWFTIDPEAKQVVRNRRASELLRVPPGSGSLTHTRRTFRFQRDGQDLAPNALPLCRAARGEVVENELMELLYDTGERRTLLVRAVPLVGRMGEVAGAVCAAADVTDRHDYEARLRLLLDELNHRVKNTLAIVQSIAIFTLKGIDEEVRHAFMQRLHNLAGMLGLLAEGDWSGAELGAVLRTSLTSLLPAERVRIEGPTLNLQPRAAFAFALAVHELATNALKYGALSNTQGRVTVRWTTMADRVRLIWEETGGPSVTVPTRKGFGTTLIQESLRAELKASVSVDYRFTGLVCLIDAPIAATGLSA